MAKNKDDIKYATAQAKLSEDESLRVAYVANTPLEAGKIADFEPVDLFAAAHNISNQQQDKRVIAESKPLDIFSAAKGVSDANQMDEGTDNHQPSSK
ncbi:hypothetical protein HanRHA438_Chr11g0495971 [Helianthus annuus]|nr:hypothetical protein HanHA300_Chr11g0395841 [Helianthus annuus]KAJ0684909.1 hypothetical protein HanLR1_Chr11g0396521 [Helianthus annuus]KAJ0688834.1 hypothetical protein HanOQP8_Chr11g0398721 [Helianthus annuus]KAJ0870055.1 hypothetical protein HanRHA438_Chr11g0495971 [Helianthus annuus]